MNLRQILSILLARYKIALLLFIVTVGSALAFATRQAPYYEAETSVLVDVRANDPLSAMIIPNSLGTQVELITSERVARRVVRALKLDQDPTARQMWLEATDGRGRIEDWLASRLQKSTKVTPQYDKNVIGIAFRAGDPNFVAMVANALAQAYIDTVVELKVEPARQHATWFETQVGELREKMELAQSRLSQFQRSRGIVDRDDRMDVEMAQLRDLSAQLTALQTQSADSRVRQQSGADTLPEVMSNPLISSLRSDIARREAALQETAVNFGTNHPQYRRQESEIASLKEQLELETQHVTRSLATVSDVSSGTESELQSAVQRQRQKVLALRSGRDQLEVLQREMESATRAYEAVVNRFHQSSLEGQTTRTNVLVLAPAIVPLDPAVAHPLPKVMLASVMLGLMLGLGAAFGIEMLDRRVRSTDDLAEMLQVPVLGVIDKVKLPRKRSFLLAGPGKPLLR